MDFTIHDETGPIAYIDASELKPGTEAEAIFWLTLDPTARTFAEFTSELGSRLDDAAWAFNVKLANSLYGVA